MPCSFSFPNTCLLYTSHQPHAVFDTSLQIVAHAHVGKFGQTQYQELYAQRTSQNTDDRVRLFSQPHAHGPVSYTHLDVYKRQPKSARSASVFLFSHVYARFTTDFFQNGVSQLHSTRVLQTMSFYPLLYLRNLFYLSQAHDFVGGLLDIIAQIDYLTVIQKKAAKHYRVLAALKCTGCLLYTSRCV